MESPRRIHEHAAENLVFIRDAMELAGSFTALPGWGAVVTGMVGLVAGVVAPALVAGALLTVACYRVGAFGLLPGLWLLLFGAAVVAGGAFSVRVLPLIGVLFLCLGAVALFVPSWLADVCLGAGFGGIHIVFGYVIARNHGG